jgi:hypothetical protein
VIVEEIRFDEAQTGLRIAAGILNRPASGALGRLVLRSAARP